MGRRSAARAAGGVLAGRGRGQRRGGASAGAGSALASAFLCAQIRASRLEQIDQELLSAQDRVPQTEAQVPGGVEPGPCPGRRNGPAAPTHIVMGL